MVRTSMYDRISEKRLAAEALAREEAQRAAQAPPIVIEPEPLPAIPLQLTQNEMRIASLNLRMPPGFSFRNSDTTLEKYGRTVTLSAKRRAAPEGLTLERSVELYVENLRKHHPDFILVRRRDCLLAGSPGVSLDYLFNSGTERSHGRAVVTIIDAQQDDERHWFSLSTVVNPDHAELAEWLIEFDAMLENITAD